jgi:hypothetical protein
MEKIIAQVESWEMLKKLPKEFGEFTLQIEMEKRGTQYCIFTYQKKKEHKSFSVLYDQATKEYFARTVIGLTEYFDVNFIVGEIQQLEDLLVQRLKNVLSNLSYFNRENIDSIVHEKEIMDWSYGEELPPKLLGFELFIKPDEPVKVINGSYIILDYSDFDARSNLTIYYNIFRDEFFGETRIKGTPTMLAVFDTKNFEDLRKIIESQLSFVLENVRRQID